MVPDPAAPGDRLGRVERVEVAAGYRRNCAELQACLAVALPLVRGFGRLPLPVNRGFAWLLNAGTAPFDVVNHWGSKAGARVFNHRRKAAKLRRGGRLRVPD